MRHLKEALLKILHFQFWQTEFPKQNENLLVSAIIAKSQSTGEKIVTNSSSPGPFSSLASFSNVLLILNVGGLRND